MIVPRFLKPGDTIGICAPSAGIREEKLEELDTAEQKLKGKGFSVLETASVRTGTEPSADPTTRAEELSSLAKDPNVNMILCAAGGDLLYEMLPYVNWEELAENPKWIQGYSDPTGLLFPLTTGYDVVTMYGGNAAFFAGLDEHRAMDENLEILCGKRDAQKSFDVCCTAWNFVSDEAEEEKEESEAPTATDENEPIGHVPPMPLPVEWKTPNGPVKLTGRLLGGCMDVMLDLIGTPWDHVASFDARHAEEGILWFFDIFALSAETVYRTLLHMKHAGWFAHAKGFIFGRVVLPNTGIDMTYEEAVKKALGSEAKIVLEADVGHVFPRMSFPNGCMATLTAEDGTGEMRYEFR